MRNFTQVVPILAAGMMLLGNAQGQQTGAAKTEAVPAATAQKVAVKKAAVPPSTHAGAKPSGPLTLQAASERGLVEYSFTGTGGSSGDSIRLRVKKTSKTVGPLTVSIPAGTILRSSNPRAQNMVVSRVSGTDMGGGLIRPASRILLSGSAPVELVLTAFCAEFEKDNPSPNTTFSLEKPDPMLACIMSAGKGLSIAAEQAAVWMYTDRTTYDHVNHKFPVNRADWSAAETVVEHCRTTPLAASPDGQGALNTRTEKFSYALGMNIGTGLGANLKRQSVEVDTNLVSQGLKDALSGGKTLLTQEEAKAALSEMQNEKTQQLAAKNKAEGEAFLAANKGKEGVVALPSGLQYKILKEGTGPKPTASDSVVCNYSGTLINGTEFDSSYKRGQPATFPVNGVIKGWTEALQLMPVGSKWQLFVPSALAYGEPGNGRGIGPDTTLIFEVELLSVQEKPKTDQAKPATEEKK